MIRRQSFLAACLCAICMIAASTASADVRYAEPGGDGAAASCLISDPCALNVATDETYTDPGDEVIVQPGVYNMGSTPVVINDNIDVRGIGATPDQTRILSNYSYAVLLQGLTASLSNVQVEGSGVSAAVQMSGGTLDRTVAVSATAYGCLLTSTGTIRNSICKCTFPTFGVGLSYQYGGGSTRNVSIRGSLIVGTAYGIDAQTYNAGSAVTIDAKSSIFDSTTGAIDVLVNAVTAGSSMDLAIDHSNFALSQTVPGSSGTMSVTAAGTGTNQTGAPLFVNAGGDDYRQAAGSPTINAGAVDGLSGLLDLDGAIRTSGPAPDIGPYEMFEAQQPGTPAPPTADTTAPVTKIKKGPKKLSRTRRAKFVFSVSEPGLTFKCKLDKGRYRACSSRFTKTVKRGRHRFYVIATDAAGNSDATPATYKWRVL